MEHSYAPASELLARVEEPRDRKRGRDLHAPDGDGIDVLSQPGPAASVGARRQQAHRPLSAPGRKTLGGTVLGAQGTIEYGGQIKVNAILAYDGGFLAVRHAEPGPANSLYILAGEWR
jgi:hypothetical protein